MKKPLWLGFLSLAVITAFAAWLLATFFQWLKALDPSVAAASITALIGLIGLWFSLWHSKSRDIAESHRSSKIAVYSVFFDIVERFQKSDPELEKLDEVSIPEPLREEFLKLNRGMILWASPAVIAAWLKFRRVSSTGGTRAIFVIDEVYRAIRKDLGNSNFGLNRGDLARISLKDPDELK